jgi:hypothetical protein
VRGIVMIDKQKWHAEFEYWNILMNTMLKAIPNFERQDSDFVLRKALKYYATINTISLKIIMNRKNPWLRLITTDIEYKVIKARVLLLDQISKKEIPNEWDSKLPNLEISA